MNKTILFRTKFLNLCQTTFENTQSKESTWIFAERPNQQNAVLIVPLIKIDNDIELVIIKEFRAPINGYEYGFPAGLIESNEDILNTIKRELKEETNLDFLKLLKPLSPPVYNSAGMTNEAVTIAFVEVTGEISNKNLETNENIITYRYKKHHVQKLIENLAEQKNYAGAKSWIIFDIFANTNYLQNMLK
jgi:ADP-ribose pyrophosphatase